MKISSMRIPWNSIRFKLVAGLLTIIVPLISVLIYNNFYAINVIHNQVAESNKNMVSLYMNQIDKSLEDIDTYLSRLTLSDDNLKVMLYTTDMEDYHLAEFRLNRRFSEDVQLSKNIDSVFVFDGRRNSLVEGFNEGSTFRERENVRAFIINSLTTPGHSGSESRGWTVEKISNEYYLFKILKTNDIYIGAWVSAKKMLIPLNLVNLGKNGTSLLVTNSGETMVSSKVVEDKEVDLKKDEGNYYLTGEDNNYLAVGEKSFKGDFKLIALIPDEEILEKLPFIQRVVTIIAIGAVILLPLCLIFLRKALLVPLKRILKAMKRIHEGNLDFRIEAYNTSDEFKVVNETFNEMIEQIQQLRISVYEEQLSKQKAELQHLQLQVNPHFFLNSLNIIYSLAQTKKYELIQEMTLSLVKYFRYMFRSNLEYVSLRDELQHVKNYIQIQQLRFPNTLTWDIEVEDSLMNTSIPPLAIQNFIENSVKYGVTMDDPIHISVRITKQDSESDEFIKIVIKDTGRGFTEEVLEELRAGNKLINNEGKHIGVWNVQRRLSLLYGENSLIKFYNDDVTKGAVVEIILPVRLAS